MKTALVLEGGGMRCVYTSGIIDALLENNVEVDVCYGVSAGAYAAQSFISKQYFRAYRTCTEYRNDSRYFGLVNFFLTGSAFGEKFVYHTIPDELIKLDYEAFDKSKTTLVAVCVDVESGKAEYMPINDIKKDMDCIRASGSLPLISAIVNINGRKYLDGGIADSIPVKRAFEDGADKVIAVMTQNKGFVKTVTSNLRRIKIAYKKYPNFVHAVATRHERYNEALRFIEKKTQEGSVFAFYPSKPVEVGRIDKDITRIEALYKNGLEDGRNAMPELMKFLQRQKEE